MFFYLFLFFIINLSFSSSHKSYNHKTKDESIYSVCESNSHKSPSLTLWLNVGMAEVFVTVVLISDQKQIISSIQKL